MFRFSCARISKAIAGKLLVLRHRGRVILSGAHWSQHRLFGRACNFVTRSHVGRLNVGLLKLSRLTLVGYSFVLLTEAHAHKVGLKRTMSKPTQLDCSRGAKKAKPKLPEEIRLTRISLKLYKSLPLPLSEVLKVERLQLEGSCAAREEDRPV